MDTLLATMEWAYRVFATWYVAAIVGGVLILVAERLSRRAEPSDADVKRAAERYRQWYGGEALSVIGDHILAAAFAPDSRYKQFLQRVAEQLSAEWITLQDRERAIAAGQVLTDESRLSNSSPNRALQPLPPRQEGRDGA